MKPLNDEEQKEMMKELFSFLGAKCPYCLGKGRVYDLELFHKILEVVRVAKEKEVSK